MRKKKCKAGSLQFRGRKVTQAEAMKLLKYFLQPGRNNVKSILPNPNLEYRIVFKKGAVETIKRAKGWKTDAEMARALGLTRAYISMLVKTRVSVSSTVITRLAAQMGNTEVNWWVYYDIVPWGVSDPNHPTFNNEKYKGQIPYDRFSVSEEIRSLDYKAERKNTD